MRLLPSEQEAAMATIPDIMEVLRREGRYSISEPCNCGSHIQHNNGGNYHDIYGFAYDKEQYFIQRDTTCDLTAPAEWELSSIEEIEKILSECLADGW